ncbi:MAG TPA: Ni/Fe hydrogenase subunit alpha [Candidatus Binataceae bacterium]|nr:Ni/Fe hydrogenase subunit alpha [Candidatus Binataceae bacterium]
MKTIKVNYLARVEGEGALRIRFRGDQVRDVELRIFEPPRFFEAFLRGRHFAEAPDLTARICGICPVAYQMSACAAVEDALAIRVPDHISDLRRLIYCGEWIESHSLHMFMLHAPDFLGFDGALEMAKSHRDAVSRGLAIKRAGNELIRTLGGREVHPINVRVGGFYSLPAPAELRALIPNLTAARESAREALEWMSHFEFPEFERDYEFVALRGERNYPFIGNRLQSNKGLDIGANQYDEAFEERQVSHSNALQSVIKARDHYVCGPLARFNLNFDLLTKVASEAARGVGLAAPCRNPFRSILVRCIETIEALEQAITIIENYDGKGAAHVEAKARAGTGYGLSEAPRGTLYHRYRIDEAGLIDDANIVPPTSQNQPSIEDDLREIAPRMLTLDHAEATRLAERAVRNYDPCISCATHFLKLTMERE